MKNPVRRFLSLPDFLDILPDMLKSLFYYYLFNDIAFSINYLYKINTFG